jgi:hypothetical protein
MSVIFQPQPQHDVQVSCVVCAPVYSRGRYGELTNTISGQSVKEILAQFAPCLPGEFAQFDHRKRGDAVNWDLYGWDRAQNVAVIQIRHAWRRKATHFLSVHKT